MRHATWRILTAVPQTWHTHLEIAKALRALVEDPSKEQIRHRRAEIAALRCEFEAIADELHIAIYDAASQASLELQKFNDAAHFGLIDKAGYRRDQPRWRKGSGRKSGRWSGGAGMLAAERRKRRKGGHHYVPQEIYEKLFARQKLKAETGEVFDEGVTGPLPPGLHKNDKEHRAYTKAVFALWHRFLEENGISSDEMTPEQAHEFLHEVLHSSEPRIRDYNARFR